MLGAVLLLAIECCCFLGGVTLDERRADGRHGVVGRPSVGWLGDGDAVRRGDGRLGDKRGTSDWRGSDGRPRNEKSGVGWPKNEWPSVPSRKNTLTVSLCRGMTEKGDLAKRAIDIGVNLEDESENTRRHRSTVKKGNLPQLEEADNLGQGQCLEKRVCSDTVVRESEDLETDLEADCPLSQRYATPESVRKSSVTTENVLVASLPQVVHAKDSPCFAKRDGFDSNCTTLSGEQRSLATEKNLSPAALGLNEDVRIVDSDENDSDENDFEPKEEEEVLKNSGLDGRGKCLGPSFSMPDSGGLEDPRSEIGSDLKEMKVIQTSATETSPTLPNILNVGHLEGLGKNLVRASTEKDLVSFSTPPEDISFTIQNSERSSAENALDFEEEDETTMENQTRLLDKENFPAEGYGVDDTLDIEDEYKRPSKHRLQQGLCTSPDKTSPDILDNTSSDISDKTSPDISGNTSPGTSDNTLAGIPGITSPDIAANDPRVLCSALKTVLAAAKGVGATEDDSYFEDEEDSRPLDETMDVRRKSGNSRPFGVSDEVEYDEKEKDPKNCELGGDVTEVVDSPEDDLRWLNSKDYPKSAVNDAASKVEDSPSKEAVFQTNRGQELDFDFELVKSQAEKPTKTCCSSSCHLEIVETIPVGLKFPCNSPMTRSTFEAWKELLALSRESIDVGSFYWTLRGSDIGVDDPSQKEGVEILEELKKKANILRVLWSTPDGVPPGGRGCV